MAAADEDGPRVTMQINAADRIGGLPILEVRDLLRRFPLGFHSVSLERAGFSGYRAKRLIRALIVIGYLEASAAGLEHKWGRSRA